MTYIPSYIPYRIRLDSRHPRKKEYIRYAQEFLAAHPKDDRGSAEFLRTNDLYDIPEEWLWHTSVYDVQQYHYINEMLRRVDKSTWRIDLQGLWRTFVYDRSRK